MVSEPDELNEAMVEFGVEQMLSLKPEQVMAVMMLIVRVLTPGCEDEYRAAVTAVLDEPDSNVMLRNAMMLLVKSMNPDANVTVRIEEIDPRLN